MLSLLHQAILQKRVEFYEKGVFKSFSLGGFVVSVGNLTVGGTGKTPLVAFVAEILADGGEKVCILSRGYGRADARKRVLVSDGERILADARHSGDEPFELAGKLLGKAVVVADANRAAAGVWAREKFGITAFVLDDAFQHRKVKRDWDIVTVDATNPFGGGKLLPAGILREPLENLKRADAIVITRANLVEEKQIIDLKFEIKQFNKNCRIFVAENKISRLINLKEFPAKAQSFAERRDADGKRQLTTDNCLAFCALGNPEKFFEQLRRENFSLAETRKFSDHYFYTQNDIENLEKLARQRDAKILLTTAKDAVKLKDIKFDLPCFVVESELMFDAENVFCKWILKMR